MATIDDAYNLLNAMNETTLGRIEGEIKDLRSLLDAVNATTLGRIEGEMKAIQKKVGA